MSMKRTKQRSSGSGRSDEDGADVWAKPVEPEPTWAEVESKPAGSFIAFAMSSRYAKGDLISHPKFGKGLVVAAEPTRIEVLFQDGKKKLGHSVVA